MGNVKPKYHVCCNQLEHRWEILDAENKLIFKGSLDQVTTELSKPKYNDNKED